LLGKGFFGGKENKRGWPLFPVENRRKTKKKPPYPLPGLGQSTVGGGEKEFNRGRNSNGLKRTQPRTPMVH